MANIASARVEITLTDGTRYVADIESKPTDPIEGEIGTQFDVNEAALALGSWRQYVPGDPHVSVRLYGQGELRKVEP